MFVLVVGGGQGVLADIVASFELKGKAVRFSFEF